MKYNLSKIMTQAHSIRREKGCTLSMALRLAWVHAKLEIVEEEMFLHRMCDRWDNAGWAKYHTINGKRQALRDSIAGLEQAA